MLAAAGQSCNEQTIAQALRATFPHNLAATKEFVHVLDGCEELTEETDVAVEPVVEDEELDDVDGTENSAHVQCLQQVGQIWNSSGGRQDVSGASAWDILIDIAQTKSAANLWPKFLHLCSSLNITVALQSQHKT